MKYIEVDRARMEPDIYDGPNADQHRPRWIVGVPKEGDEEIDGPLKMEASHFPPGTQVVIKEPLCPKCGERYVNCMVRGYEPERECDFDWHEWADKKFA